MNILFLLIGLVLGLVIGFFFANSRKGGSQNIDNDYQKILTDKTVLEDRLKTISENNQASINNLNLQIEKLNLELSQSRNQILTLNQELERERTSLKTQLEAKKEEIANQQKLITEMQNSLTKDFEVIANKILDEKSHKFTEQNKNNLDIILNPLKEKIKSFEEKVENTYRAEANERNTLKGSIEELMKLNKQISDEANNLSSALKGNTKQQGNWGEFVLEKILESSGLIEGENYVLQAEGMGLVDAEGNRYQPDVVVHLPDEKHIIIDSKVSLIAYEKLVSTNETELKEKYIKEHIASIKAHILNLSNKNYQDLFGVKSPDFVLLFVPIESSFSIAIQNDKDLFEFAWNKKIVIVTPSTLLATLKTVASIWKQEKQTRNALDIAKQAGSLYDKFVGFTEDLKKIGDQLNKTQQTYNDAFSKLHTGKGNLTNSIENLKKLGAKTKKQIDKSLLDEEPDQLMASADDKDE